MVLRVSIFCRLFNTKFWVTHANLKSISISTTSMIVTVLPECHWLNPRSIFFSLSEYAKRQPIRLKHSTNHHNALAALSDSTTSIMIRVTAACRGFYDIKFLTASLLCRLRFHVAGSYTGKRGAVTKFGQRMVFGVILMQFQVEGISQACQWPATGKLAKKIAQLVLPIRLYRNVLRWTPM